MVEEYQDTKYEVSRKEIWYPQGLKPADCRVGRLSSHAQEGVIHDYLGLTTIGGADESGTRVKWGAVWLALSVKVPPHGIPEDGNLC